MSYKMLFENTAARLQSRGYKTMYVALDLHGTVFAPSKHSEIVDSKEVATTDIYEDCKFYDKAKECLQIMSFSPNVKLIIWSSSKQEDLQRYISFFIDNNIKIDGVNENPDCPGNDYADFSKKFCFDVLLDDKAGFDPSQDWYYIEQFLMKNSWTVDGYLTWKNWKQDGEEYAEYMCLKKKFANKDFLA